MISFNFLNSHVGGGGGGGRRRKGYFFGASGTIKKVEIS